MTVNITVFFPYSTPQPMEIYESVPPILEYQQNYGLPRPNFPEMYEKAQKARLKTEKSPRRSPARFIFCL
jgi:hypothetical protein